MRTTRGKTSAPRREARSINIYAPPATKPAHTRKASSLRQALLEFYKQVLFGKGHQQPKVVGNTLTTVCGDRVVQHIALETYQQPTWPFVGGIPQGL